MQLIDTCGLVHQLGQRVLEHVSQELQNKCSSLKSSLKLMQDTVAAKSSELTNAVDKYVCLVD
jgi:carbon monoxide dehydrogenase subunit G